MGEFLKFAFLALISFSPASVFFFTTHNSFFSLVSSHFFFLQQAPFPSSATVLFSNILNVFSCSFFSFQPSFRFALTAYLSLYTSLHSIESTKQTVIKNTHFSIESILLEQIFFLLCLLNAMFSSIYAAEPFQKPSVGFLCSSLNKAVYPGWCFSKNRVGRSSFPSFTGRSNILIPPLSGRLVDRNSNTAR